MRPVYAKDDVCMGCGLCEVYCALAHSTYLRPYGRLYTY